MNEVYKGVRTDYPKKCIFVVPKTYIPERDTTRQERHQPKVEVIVLVTDPNHESALVEASNIAWDVRDALLADRTRGGNCDSTEVLDGEFGPEYALLQSGEFLVWFRLPVVMEWTVTN